VDDRDLMGLALEEARRGAATGNGEVGVVIARAGRPLYRGYNRINVTSDITGHAEVQALRDLSQRLERLDLAGHTLYCTLEPCGMCTCACAWARISRIVFGASRLEVPERYFELEGLSCEAILAHARVRVEVTGGVLGEECRRLYSDAGA
jgi:tRNA(adenine34) deaminase